MAEENIGTIDSFLMQALQIPKDRIFILKLDKELETFINDESRNKLVFPQMNSYQRRVVHRVAEYFKLTHVLDGEKRYIIIYKNESSTIPILRLGDLVEMDEAAQPSMKIMQRKSKTEGAGGNRAGDKSSGTNKEQQERTKLSLQERESKYLEARARIFNEGGSTVSDDGTVTGSTVSSTATSPLPSKYPRQEQTNSKVQPSYFEAIEPPNLSVDTNVNRTPQTQRNRFPEPNRPSVVPVQTYHGEQYYPFTYPHYDPSRPGPIPNHATMTDSYGYPTVDPNDPNQMQVRYPYNTMPPMVHPYYNPNPYYPNPYPNFNVASGPPPNVGSNPTPLYSYGGAIHYWPNEFNRRSTKQRQLFDPNQPIDTNPKPTSSKPTLTPPTSGKVGNGFTNSDPDLLSEKLADLIVDSNSTTGSNQPSRSKPSLMYDYTGVQYDGVKPSDLPVAPNHILLIESKLDHRIRKLPQLKGATLRPLDHNSKFLAVFKSSKQADQALSNLVNEKSTTDGKSMELGLSLGRVSRWVPKLEDINKPRIQGENYHQ